MKKLKKQIKSKFKLLLSVVVLSSTFLISCNDDDDNISTPSENYNVVEIVQAIPGLSTLNSAILAAGLETALASEGPFTLFAPTNAAFANLDPATLNNIISTPSLLTALLQYHVVSGYVTSDQLTNGDVPTLLSGQSIAVNVDSGVTLNSTAQVLEADVIGTNGVVHIIDQVLLPEDFVAQTIVQIAASNPDFSTLVSILTKPELADLLAAANDPTQDLTVLAPTNDAFNALLAALEKDSIDDLPVTLLREIVMYHILGMSVESSELTDGAMVETLLMDEFVTVNISGNEVKINDSNVIAADVKAINGVIHVLDAVLVPGYVAQTVGSIAEVIMFDPNYTILVEALKIADLLETISTAPNLTLFTPDNAAFIAAGIASLDGLDAEALSPILLYHVLGAKVLSSQLPADGMATTLSSDEKMYLGYLTNIVLINGLSQITEVDIEKDNGVVHRINRTLIPPAIDIVDIAVALSDMGGDSQFTVLVSILSMPEYSDIAAAIKVLDNVTLFAPTDEAFEAIADVLPTLSVDQVRNVLTYHALSARVFSSQLVDGQVVPMLNQETVTVNISNNGVTLTDMSMGADANVVEVNVHGSNGVIHVIDKVLIPNL